MDNERYEARIRELEEQIRRLTTANQLTIHAGAVAGGASETQTVAGLEEMIIQVGSDRSISYVNGPMARLLECPDRKAILGEPVTSLARQAQPESFDVDALLAVLEACFAANQPVAIEREFPNLNPTLLPDTKAQRPNTAPVLRMAATSQKGSVHAILQDVTQLRWLESMFSRYVSPRVLELMQNSEHHGFATAELKEVSVLFADLRGFTAMCEELEPEAVRDTVNSFFEGMVEAVDTVGGTVDKFVGDEIMALFGAPLDDPSHGLNSLLCALDMQAKHRAWVDARRADRLPAPALGIGIATGTVVLGNIGTPSRMDYTALGTTVNLAARLCSAAGPGEILTVRSTYGAATTSAEKRPSNISLPHIQFRKKGQMEFKNVKEPVDVIGVASAHA